MMNKVLWTLDNELSHHNFERLCVDLLCRNDYPNIVPVGGVHDRGRDAESVEQKPDGTSERTFFQFTLQKDWKKKLRAELEGVSSREHDIACYVFITTQEVSGRDRDKLSQEVAEKYGWILKILPREWLRLQLEVVNPDLASRYLGIHIPQEAQRLGVPVSFSDDDTPGFEAVWELFDRGLFERAALESKEFLKKNGQSGIAWQVLAWSQYELFHYDEALAAINVAIDINASSRQSKSIRACILAERGIRQENQESVREASEIFLSLLPDSTGMLHYNYGNTLSALSRYREAAKQFQMAAKLVPTDPRIWKNLATAYHEMGKHKKEMECFDKALELEPDQPQALASKGVSLLIDFGRAEEAIVLLERAVAVSPGLLIRWPLSWYWLGEAYRSAGRFEDARRWVQRGLRQEPGFDWLKRLEFTIVSEEWKEIPSRIESALGYFKAILRDNPLAYAAREELTLIYAASGRENEAWKLLSECFMALGHQINVDIQDVGFTLSEVRKALRHLPFYILMRKGRPVARYWETGDSILDFHEAPPKDLGFEEQIFGLSAIPFGLARDALVETSGKQVNGRKVYQILSGLCPNLETVFAAITRSVAEWVLEPAEDHLGSFSERLAVVANFLQDVGIREGSTQVGWLATTFRISDSIAEKAAKKIGSEGGKQKIALKSIEALLTVGMPRFRNGD